MKQPRPTELWAWWLAVAWLALVVLVALCADFLPLSYPAATPDLYAITQPPFAGPHWLGTDPLGRDVLAGLIFGARTACLVSAPAGLAAAVIGTILGSAAGYWGNQRLKLPAGLAFLLVGLLLFWGCFTGPGPWFLSWLVVVGLALVAAARLMRLSERVAPQPLPLDTIVLSLLALLTSVPQLVLALAIAAVWPPSLSTLVAVLTFTYWPVTAQLVRADMRRIRQLPYMEAARAIGLPTWQIMGRHAFPLLWKTIRVTLPLSLATLIGLETTVSFLGVGLPLETASWGRTLATARLDFTAWWLIVFPACAILLTTLALRQLPFYPFGKSS
ncbi:ABC transporter permease [Hymenobacter elongatus]|uniref:ABC transporter permease n=1 Tax=Hymenobacter elongatus TaxID=877208 RepID=A0A4Z0PG74_9BACT|nr:ABC transporter permease [Hymenobacter elongatus]TGE13802.1 ABC transporter permease [Hymenobacter elongatus]